MFFTNAPRRLISLALIALLLLGVAPTALAAKKTSKSVPTKKTSQSMQAKATKSLYVKADAKLYKSARTSSKVLKKLPRGTKIEQISVKGAWAKVKYDGKLGYAKKTALSENAPAQVEEIDPTTAYIKATAYLYKSAKSSSKKLQKLKAGAELLVYKEMGSWTKVKVNGKNGYVQTKKISANKPQSAAPSEPAYEALQSGDKGDVVKKLQTRLKALGWFYGAIGGNYLQLTTQAVTDFQEAANLSQTGVADETTQKALYASNAPRFVITGVSTASPAKGKVYGMDWWSSGISSIFARGSKAVVTDVRTGISFRVWRGGGTNHADVQPVTPADTAAMKKAYGGNWSWNRRAIWVSIGGKRYAASMNGMPHGGGSISGNNFDGHFCIHFTNSRTHGTNVIDAQHQEAIRMALSAG